MHKIEVKKGSDFTTELEVYLRQNYNYSCVVGVAEMQRSDYALTDSGLIKTYNNYEKDDSINQKEHFILGWDNRETIIATQRNAKATEALIQDLNRQIRQSKTERNALQTRRDTLTRLLNFENFLLLERRALQVEFDL